MGSLVGNGVGLGVSGLLVERGVGLPESKENGADGYCVCCCGGLVGADGIWVGCCGGLVDSDGIRVGCCGGLVGSDGIRVGCAGRLVGSDGIWVGCAGGLVGADGKVGCGAGVGGCPGGTVTTMGDRLGNIEGPELGSLPHSPYSLLRITPQPMRVIKSLSNTTTVLPLWSAYSKPSNMLK